MNMNSMQKMICSCGKEARYNEVIKSTRNKGRFYFSCGEVPKVCNFFKWADEPLMSAEPASIKRPRIDTPIPPTLHFTPPSTPTQVTERGTGIDIFALKLLQERIEKLEFKKEETDKKIIDKLDYIIHQLALSKGRTQPIPIPLQIKGNQPSIMEEIDEKDNPYLSE